MWWQTVDQGTVFVDSDTPMRKLLHQQIEQTKWRDADGNESVKVTVPKEEVMLVSYNKY